MDFSGIVAPLIFFGPLVMFFYTRRKYKKENKKLRDRNAVLEPYSEVVDAHEEAERILALANEKLYQAGIKDKQAQKYFSDVISEAKEKAAEIIQNAEVEARENKEKSESYSRTAEAMKNLINGYGNDYIIPSNSLLDGLADTYGYTQASEDYKKFAPMLRA